MLRLDGWWMLRLDGWPIRTSRVANSSGFGAGLQDSPDVVRNVIQILDVLAEVQGNEVQGHRPCHHEVRVYWARQGELLGVCKGTSASHTCTDLATASADLSSLPWQEARIFALWQVKGPCI